MNFSAVSATSRQPLSMVSAWPRPGISTISVTPFVALLPLERGVGDGPGHGVVLLAGDDQERAPLRVLACRPSPRSRGSGWRWPPGRAAGPGRARRRSRRAPSPRPRAPRWRRRSGTARTSAGPRDPVRRVAEHGPADFSAENGSGSTPRNGAGSMATVGDRQTPARQDLRQQATERVPDDDRPLRRASRSTSSKWSATWPTVLSANTSGCAVASLDRLGVVGPARRQRGVARFLEHRRASGPSCSAAATARGRTPLASCLSCSPATSFASCSVIVAAVFPVAPDDAFDIVPPAVCDRGGKYVPPDRRHK